MPALAMMAFIMGFFASLRARMKTISCSDAMDTPKNFRTRSVPVPFGVDHRAAGGACLPGGVHHQVGGPLVGNDHDQIVGNLPFHSSFSLLFMQQIFLGGGSADAVHRHSHQNALAGHIQPQVTGRLAHQPGGPGDTQNSTAFSVASRPRKSSTSVVAVP